jgi:hypothetical protein
VQKKRKKEKKLPPAHLALDPLGLLCHGRLDARARVIAAL